LKISGRVQFELFVFESGFLIWTELFHQ